MLPKDYNYKIQFTGFVTRVEYVMAMNIYRYSTSCWSLESHLAFNPLPYGFRTSCCPIEKTPSNSCSSERKISGASTMPGCV
jgi:hypothetical protein